MIETTTKRLYEFGAFRLDASRRLLLRGGDIVPLTHKAFETLAFLVENSGRVVEKDELLREIWPDTFVEEGSLSRNISVLRKTLGESPSDNEYIQTIPKQGYRFVADVREVTEQEIQPENTLLVNGNGDLHGAGATPRQVLPARGTSRGPVYLFVSAALLVIVAAALYVFFIKRDTSTSSSSMTVTRFTTNGKSIDAAISLDGRYVVYVVSDGGNQSLWVKQVTVGSQVQIVPPANVSYQGLAFSGDGNYVFYDVWDKEHVGAIYRIPVLGGVATRIINDVMPTLAVSPDSQQIAFVRSVSATDEQFVMVANADGSDERRVITRDREHKGWFWQPAWSPDGKTIACAVGNIREHGSSYMRVVTAPAAGGEEKNFSDKQWVDLGGLAWTSDGKGLIITASDQVRTPMQLWSLSYPDGVAKRITNDVNGYFGVSLTADSRTLISAQGEVLSNVWVSSGKDQTQPQKITSGRYEGLALGWTPDNRVVFVSEESGNDDIWMMDSDGGNRKQLTADPGVDFFPTAAADGKHIIFVSLRGGGAPHLWMMNADGSDQRQLTDGDGEWAPVCSPAGPFVFYLSGGDHGIWKLPLEGGKPIKLHNEHVFLPAISSDGKRMAYSYWDDRSKPESLKQEISDVDGSQRTAAFEIPKTAIGRDSDIQLRWSPDGRAIAFIDKRGGVSNIWSLPLVGGPAVQLTDFKEGEIFSFDWSRDGKLAMARGSLTHDVVLISNFK